MLFGQNTFVKLAIIVSGALAQIQPGSNYQISVQSPGFLNNEALNICADFNTSSVKIKSGACATPAQGNWKIDGVRSRQNCSTITIHTTQVPGFCGRFGCTIAAESVEGSALHLAKKPAYFEIMQVTNDMYKVALAGSNPSLYWTLGSESDSAGIASIVLQEAKENGRLQTFKFIPRRT